MDIELWKPVDRFTNYEVSNRGRVRNVTRNHILKQGTFKQGYKYVTLSDNTYKKTLSVHRLVAYAFIPNLENKPQVNHLNNISDDNRVLNLEWVTHQENMDHGKLVKAFPQGVNAFNSKLTDRQVRQIVIDSKSMSEPQMSKKYNVSEPAIRSILTGNTWRHITGIPKTKNRGILNRITNQDAHNIRQKRLDGVKVVNIAKEYGLSVSHVYDIIKGKYWN